MLPVYSLLPSTLQPRALCFFLLMHGVKNPQYVLARAPLSSLWVFPFTHSSGANTMFPPVPLFWEVEAWAVLPAELCSRAGCRVSHFQAARGPLGTLALLALRGGMSAGWGPNVGFPNFPRCWGWRQSTTLTLACLVLPVQRVGLQWVCFTRSPDRVSLSVFAAFTFPVLPGDSPGGALGLLLLLSGE